MNGQSHSFRAIVTAFGNGDAGRGERLLTDIANRLAHARGKHEWRGRREEHGLYAVMEESRELKQAVICGEGPQRVYDESLDVIATAIRMCNTEWRA